ncbi:uncharacterized protein RHOBADRAFT_56586 [Rhodotorula graminis WP1]|uniref:Uncharacterized protein n=1 Tax=Rhodotorula graminis (strain WP1) TaxID=578459 RepID=A0A0P9EIT5_RHOGW|nr:uncharacterized protein RHOBADRAFT_56586 [Rhodotorula graminis WP1]KPV71550.1 hypothetical protein RHOBADRAFT_56586 [Rhodotorula graminis WP1]
MSPADLDLLHVPCDFEASLFDLDSLSPVQLAVASLRTDLDSLVQRRAYHEFLQRRDECEQGFGADVFQPILSVPLNFPIPTDISTLGPAYLLLVQFNPLCLSDTEAAAAGAHFIALVRHATAGSAARTSPDVPVSAPLPPVGTAVGLAAPAPPAPVEPAHDPEPPLAKIPVDRCIVSSKGASSDPQSSLVLDVKGDGLIVCRSGGRRLFHLEPDKILDFTYYASAPIDGTSAVSPPTILLRLARLVAVPHKLFSSSIVRLESAQLCEGDAGFEVLRSSMWAWAKQFGFGARSSSDLPPDDTSVAALTVSKPAPAPSGTPTPPADLAMVDLTASPPPRADPRPPTPPVTSTTAPVSASRPALARSTTPDSVSAPMSMSDDSPSSSRSAPAPPFLAHVELPLARCAVVHQDGQEDVVEGPLVVRVEARALVVVPSEGSELRLEADQMDEVESLDMPALDGSPAVTTLAFSLAELATSATATHRSVVVRLGIEIDPARDEAAWEGLYGAVVAWASDFGFEMGVPSGSDDSPSPASASNVVPYDDLFVERCVVVHHDGRKDVFDGPLVMRVEASALVVVPREGSELRLEARQTHEVEYIDMSTLDHPSTRTTVAVSLAELATSTSTTHRNVVVRLEIDSARDDEAWQGLCEAVMFMAGEFGIRLKEDGDDDGSASPDALAPVELHSAVLPATTDPAPSATLPSPPQAPSPTLLRPTSSPVAAAHNEPEIAVAASTMASGTPPPPADLATADLTPPAPPVEPYAPTSSVASTSITSWLPSFLRPRPAAAHPAPTPTSSSSTSRATSSHVELSIERCVVVHKSGREDVLEGPLVARVQAQGLVVVSREGFVLRLEADQMDEVEYVVPPTLDGPASRTTIAVSLAEVATPASITHRAVVVRFEVDSARDEEAWQGLREAMTAWAGEFCFETRETNFINTTSLAVQAPIEAPSHSSSTFPPQPLPQPHLSTLPRPHAPVAAAAQAPRTSRLPSALPARPPKGSTPPSPGSADVANSRMSRPRPPSPAKRPAASTRPLSNESGTPPLPYGQGGPSPSRLPLKRSPSPPVRHNPPTLPPPPPQPRRSLSPRRRPEPAPDRRRSRSPVRQRDSLDSSRRPLPPPRRSPSPHRRPYSPPARRAYSPPDRRRSRSPIRRRDPFDSPPRRDRSPPPRRRERSPDVPLYAWRRTPSPGRQGGEPRWGRREHEYERGRDRSPPPPRRRSDYPPSPERGRSSAGSGRDERHASSSFETKWWTR